MLSYPAQLLVLVLGLSLAGATDNESANHIFNAIHSSTRQWGSSINHNGMSFFLATVPQGTHFYHGRATNETVLGMEWVAFEPEHALVFAHPERRPPHFAQDPSDQHSRESWETQDAQRSRLRRRRLTDTTLGHVDRAQAAIQVRPKDPQQPLQEKPYGEEVTRGGFLHTLAAKRDLRLLYIDGMAAGKSSKGTLDTTDYVLLNRNTDDDDFDGPGGGDYARAEALCSRAKNQWHGRIDGFLRMEAGFEIIVCSFEDSMTTLGMRRTSFNDRSSHGFGPFGAYMQAVSSRYDGLGGHRVAVDFESMVTAFEYPIDVFASGDLPRLEHVDPHLRSIIREDVDTLVAKKSMPPRDWLDWQAIADMIVGRWGKELAHLQSHNFTTLEDMQNELEQMYRPFIDYDHRSAATEIRQCSSQFMPPRYQKSVASTAVSTVATRICRSLHIVLQQDNMTVAQETLTGLVDYLQWPSWKRCTGCTGNEVCFVPVWPFGSTQDHKSPSCLNAEEMWQRHGYWGNWGRKRPGSD